MYAKKITERDYIKANRKASREAEIENHSHPVSFSRVHKSKKGYDRRKQKADDKRHLPSLFFTVKVLREVEKGISLRSDTRSESYRFAF